jgi:hypothetical protein
MKVAHECCADGIAHERMKYKADDWILRFVFA